MTDDQTFYSNDDARSDADCLDLLWVGDALVDRWLNCYNDAWTQLSCGRRVGVWEVRDALKHAKTEDLKPFKAAVVVFDDLVPTIANDLADAREKVLEIVDELFARSPNAQIILLGALPRGEAPDSFPRRAVKDFNALLERSCQERANQKLRFYDVCDLFLDKNGELSKNLRLEDGLLDANGYEMLARAVEPLVADALEETPEDCRIDPPLPDLDWWLPRFHEKNELLKRGGVDLLMLGDSLTHYFDKSDLWPTDGSEAWQKYFAKYRPINLGHSGDSTQHLLWRVNHYDFSNVDPKVAFVLIGVNNTWLRDRPHGNIALGQRRVVKRLREIFPKMKIVVLKLFPCAVVDDQNAENKAVNELTPFYVRDIENVDVLDISPVFLNRDGLLTKDISPDLSHLNKLGYDLWGAALFLKLQELME